MLLTNEIQYNFDTSRWYDEEVLVPRLDPISDQHRLYIFSVNTFDPFRVQYL